ncbi:carbohydrate ABC transporter permease [soil metagenome]
MTGRLIGRGLLTAVAILISLLFLLPVLWLIASTFRTSRETFQSSSPLSWSVLWPKEFTLVNLESAVNSGFMTALGNSLLVALVTVIVGLVISAMAAFALAVIPFRGRGVTFSIVVLSFLVPFEAIAIPLSRSFSDWGLTNTLIALILPGLGNGLAVFTLRQFFLGVPHSLSEAAHLDGANWFRIFWSVYLPLTRPALIGAGLILFLFQWQAYLWPILVTSRQELDLAPVAIAKAFGAFTTDYGRVFAETAILAIIPAIVLLALQRYFVTSVASTGSKE